MSTAARIDELRSKFDENPRRYFAPLANEYRKAGELSQAIALCREHLPKQPGHMSGHIVFGQALYENGDLIEAQEVFEAALILDPENLIALRHLGDIARTRGDAAQARRWYERVLDADPRNDDIAALLSSLTQRLTPRSAPIAATAVDPYTGAPAYAERPADSDAAEDPFSAPDAPAWHTPAFLTPLASEAISPTPVAEASADEPQLLDLDFLADRDEPSPASESDAAPSYATSPHAEIAAAPFEHREQIEQSVEAADPLAEALDAFATNDPFESDASTDAVLSLADEPVVSFADDVPSFSHAEHHDTDSASVSDETVNEPVLSSAADDEFEEGLVAIEWPDASLINVRGATPAHAATPISAEVIDAGLIEVSLASDESMDDAFGADAGVDTAAEEAREFGLVDMASAHAFGSSDESVSAEEHVASDEFVAADALIDVFAGATEEAPLAEALAEDADAAFGEAASAIAEADPTIALANAEDLWPEDEGVDDVVIDEDPPLSVAEVPWLAVSEEEREAAEDAILSMEASFDDEVVDAVAQAVSDDVATAEDEAESEAHVDAGASPAFVTETMAELFVAQGFLHRAVGVYEELVRRRPYDAVLSSRLVELRATLDAEAAPASEGSIEPAMEAAVEPLLESPFEPSMEASFEPSMEAPLDEPTVEATAAPDAWSAPTPLYGVTPVTSASVTPASLTPASLPLVAAAAQPTARQYFASLASMRVARRTPSLGAIAVASPTPADGLASLFGEVPMPVEDLAARSLAQAFGSGEHIEPGPSMFAPAEPDELAVPASTSVGTPESASSPSAAPAFSFDRFFPDPATAGASGNPARDAQGAPSGASVLGSDSGTDSSAPQPSTAGADLAQFAHWLKGLSNS